MIIETAKSALSNGYPSDKFQVVIIADSFKESTLTNLRKLPLKVHEVDFEFSTKAKAINSALEALNRDDFNWVLILDADNRLSEDSLHIFNGCMQTGAKAAQGHRMGHNDSDQASFAILDAISEEINNNIFRKGHRVLGLSSALIGSGMCFEISFFNKMMSGLNGVGDEDGGLEFRIFNAREKIEYLEKCYVFDEKVDSAHVFGKQRTRWIAGQFTYITKHFNDFVKAVLQLNIDVINKYLQKYLLPRLLFIGLITLSIIGLFFIDTSGAYLLLGSLGVFILANLFAIPKKFYKLKYLRVFLELPKALFYLFKEIFTSKGTLKKNFHTPHKTVSK
ncbi:MAG: glycosyltransferase family 2 protein [Cyclobacteriaceae bacterium]|nr:glycosyltransferase family 2 protein [Cyclobacteriaceae bacterium]